MHRIALFLFLFCSITVKAHQPDVSSTMLIEQENGTWILQIRASLTAFEYEVHTLFGKDSYKTPEEFNALVIKHLQKSIKIKCDQDVKVVLKNGFVKLGHETNVVFEVIGVPKSFKKLEIQNSSFKDIHHNQSALVVNKKGFEKQQFILNNENRHTAALNVLSNKFELQSNIEKPKK